MPEGEELFGACDVLAPVDAQSCGTKINLHINIGDLAGMAGRLDDLTALVFCTMSDSGVALVRALASEGAAVAVVSSSPDQVTRFLDGVTSVGATVLVVPCDPTDRRTAEDAVRTIVGEFGALNVAVIDAAAYLCEAIDLTPMDRWDFVIRRHLNGLMNICVASLAALTETATQIPQQFTTTVESTMVIESGMKSEMGIYSVARLGILGLFASMQNQTVGTAVKVSKISGRRVTPSELQSSLPA